MTVAPSFPQELCVYLPNCVSTLPTFFNVASSLPLIVGFILPFFRSISGVFRMIDSYLVVFMGQGRSRVLLLHGYLPGIKTSTFYKF